MSEASKWFRIRRTISQMLRDRGYDVGEEDLEISLDDFTMTYGDPVEVDKLGALYHYKDESNPGKILTYFKNAEKVDNQYIKELLSTCKAQGVDRCIFVCRPGSMTSGIKNAIAKSKTTGIQLEYFFEDEVMINITEHELVPKHVMLTEEQKSEVLARYKIQETQLPRILHTDPVVRYLGAPVGTVLEITRRSETAGRYITYRIVV